MSENFRNKVVLVTGASAGIGASLARRFAREGSKVVLVARRAERLAELAEELRLLTKSVHAVRADLNDLQAVPQILHEAHQQAGPIDVLVNNAGVGEYGKFATQGIDGLMAMIQLNVGALTRLTHAVLPEMIERRSGAILNVASTAAFQPTPYMAVYGATKSFVLSLSMSLWRELAGTGVSVTCLCPGPVRTEFFDRGGYESRRVDYLKHAAEPDWVADQAFRALSHRRPLIVAGLVNRLGAFLTRFAPIKTVTRVSERLLGPR